MDDCAGVYRDFPSDSSRRSLSMLSINRGCRNRMDPSVFRFMLTPRKSRDTVEVTPEARDNTRYESVTDEMIARAPHVRVVGNDTIAHPTFMLNSAKVWDIAKIIYFIVES